MNCPYEDFHGECTDPKMMGTKDAGCCIDEPEPKELMERPAGFGEKISQAQADEYRKKTKWPVGGYVWPDKKGDF